MSLKRVITFAVALLASLGLVAATSLVILTTYLHRATLSLQTAVEGIQSTEDFEVSLLDLHQRLGSRIQRGEAVTVDFIEEARRQLSAQLDRTRRQVLTEEEGELLSRVDTAYSQYLDAQALALQSPPGRMNAQITRHLETAIVAINQLISLNIQEARLNESQADRWNQMADLAGLGVAVLLVLGVVVLLVWMRRAVFHPLLGISRAMHRFGDHGERTRAPMEGAEELRDMARTFNEMADSLLNQRQARLTFLAGVAHDLRNPLSALKMSAALVTSRGPVSEERLQKTMALVSRQVSRLDRMVGDLLDATRIEAGHIELKLEERDAGELATSVVELYRSSGTAHELRLLLPEGPLPLRCDPTRVEQVLNNLVSNALKYSREGSVVDVEVRREGEEVWLSVKDQGIGISAEEQRHLFTPFQRTGSAREKAPGVGIGLSVARRIVEAHGGRIEVESSPGRGSTFRVRLPRSPSVPASREARPGPFVQDPVFS
ncbi:two-component sensor histidine kinase [Cystobacter fuscus]|uniref:histidine kinase n=1 Tax=Cystobacter fuscus TaxID=43 RepID=A0A250ITG4_9BACT|nr:HAMP domain-containing sensor histidine kinase [Cystobacter fuscus]ATB35034.1 two-component sensor histidine kinase [Cystobacter fuscus]